MTKKNKKSQQKKESEAGNAAEPPALAPTPAPALTRREINDRLLESQLNRHLNEMAVHSSAVWSFAFKEFERAGPGVVYWLFSSVDEAKLDRQVNPITYRAHESVKQMGYEPALQFLSNGYEAQRSCLALVAIRTGDKRDSLMKVLLIDRDVDTMARSKYEPKLQSLQFQMLGSNKVVKTIQDGARFCGNRLCYNVESKLNEYKFCQRCGFRAYCSRECQVMHWKASGHKEACEREKQFEVSFAAKKPEPAPVAQSQTDLKSYMQQKADEEARELVRQMMNQASSSSYVPRPLESDAVQGQASTRPAANEQSQSTATSEFDVKT